MSAVITNQGISGVTRNALHIKDGNLLVIGIDVSRNARPISGSGGVEADAASVHPESLLKQMHENGLGAIFYTDADNVDHVNLNVSSLRSNESVELRFPAGFFASPEATGTFEELTTAVADTLLIENPNDYSLDGQSEADSWDFSGSFGSGDTSQVFFVTEVSYNEAG